MNMGGVCGSPLYTYMWNPKHLNFYNYVAPSVQWVSTLWLTQHTEEDQSKHLPYCRNSTWTFLRHPVHNSRNRLSMGPRCIPSVALSCGDITNDIQRRWTLNKHGVKSAINQKGFCPDHPNGHLCQERERGWKEGNHQPCTFIGLPNLATSLSPFTAVVLLDLKDKEGLMTSKSGGGWTCWP